MPTLVFSLPGNAFAAAKAGGVTVGAAKILGETGNQSIQLSTPDLSSPAAFDGLVRQIHDLSHGQPIGIIGFSAGGAWALRLAGVSSLNVKAVLDFYGPPDLKDYFAYHGHDRFATYVESHSHMDKAAINLMSGPIITTAYVDAAFGSNDHNVVASVSTDSLQKDLPQARVFNYDGGHGVSLAACPPAMNDFIAHL
jgi:hypothetical protein